MSKHKPASIAAGLLMLFIQLPVWYYLLYHVLKAVNASDIMWFLYWIYVPVGIFCNIVVSMVKATEQQ